MARCWSGIFGAVETRRTAPPLDWRFLQCDRREIDLLRPAFCGILASDEACCHSHPRTNKYLKMGATISSGLPALNRNDSGSVVHRTVGIRKDSVGNFRDVLPIVGGGLGVMRPVVASQVCRFHTSTVGFTAAATFGRTGAQMRTMRD